MADKYAAIINYGISILGMVAAIYFINKKYKLSNEMIAGIPIRYLKTGAFIGVGIAATLLVLTLLK